MQTRRNILQYKLVRSHSTKKMSQWIKQILAANTGRNKSKTSAISLWRHFFGGGLDDAVYGGTPECHSECRGCILAKAVDSPGNHENHVTLVYIMQISATKWILKIVNGLMPAAGVCGCVCVSVAVWKKARELALKELHNSSSTIIESSEWA